SHDPSLLDVQLLAGGTYYVVVDTYTPDGVTDFDVGGYELYIQRFTLNTPATVVENAAVSVATTPPVASISRFATAAPTPAIVGSPEIPCVAEPSARPAVDLPPATPPAKTIADDHSPMESRDLRVATSAIPVSVIPIGTPAITSQPIEVDTEPEPIAPPHLEEIESQAETFDDATPTALPPDTATTQWLDEINDQLVSLQSESSSDGVRVELVSLDIKAPPEGSAAALLASAAFWVGWEREDAIRQRARNREIA